VVEDLAKIEPVDLAEVAVKLWDTEEVGRALKSLVDPGAALILVFGYGPICSCSIYDIRSTSSSSPCTTRPHPATS
jgi:hypothetical protein